MYDTTKRHKIALICDDINSIIDDETSYKHGGAGTVIRNLYLCLVKKQDYIIEIYTYKSSKFKYEQNNTKEISIKEIIGNKPLYFLNEYLQTQNYENIISMIKKPYFNGTLLQSHSIQHRLNKVLFFIRPFRYFFKDKKRMQTEQQVFSQYGNNKRFIAVSHIVKEDYVKNLNIKPSQIVVVYPGCVQQTQSQNIKNDCISFGIVANSSINKGGHLFLLALGIAKVFNVKFKVHIIAPLYKKDLLLRGITFLFGLKKSLTVYDKQKNMNNFYNNIDCLVVPSQNETFGLVCTEAMSHCKTVLVSNTAGCSELLTYNSGFTFKRNSLIDFVRKIIKIINIYDYDYEYFEELRKNSYKISQQYCWEKFTNKILEHTKLNCI